MNPSELVGTFSHEIRNPLTLINSSLQLLETDCPAVLGSALWTQIREDMQDVLRLLDDMTTMNKSSQLRRTLLSVPGFLTDIGNSIRPLMEQKDIQFDTSIDASLEDTRLFADPQKLREAITNLLLNAADAVSDTDHEKKILLLAKRSPQADDSAIDFGSDTISGPAAGFGFDAASGSHTCRLSETPATQYILIHVWDNGPGIPTEYQATLFDPFVTHKPHGTGLGLGIVRNIALGHGGSITLDTRTDLPDSYTDFCLCIPVCPPESFSR